MGKANASSTQSIEDVPAGALRLSVDGKAEYVIVVANDAIPAEKTAASELKKYLDKVTGADFDIACSGGNEAVEALGSKVIIVGPNAYFRRQFSEINVVTLECDGIAMKTDGDTIYLAGGRPRGTLYSVYTFLEEVVGCRWWTSKESYIPYRPTLEITVTDTVYVPQLQYREANFYDTVGDEENWQFAVRLKLNGHFHDIQEEYGGHYSILGWAHTFFTVMPPSRYFDEHPEWYTVDHNGNPQQLDLTNEEMTAEFIKRVLDWLRLNPDVDMIALEQEDGFGAFGGDKDERSSDTLIRFLNVVAAEVEKEFPDVYVTTLAYIYSEAPPVKAKPRDNIVIRFAPLGLSFCEPITAPVNDKSYEALKGWSAITSHLYTWDYPVNYNEPYLMPYPNWRVLAPNIRAFVNNGATYYFADSSPRTSLMSFGELRAWLISKLAWDPFQDEEALIGEFLNGYYGAAGQLIRQYLDLICDAVEREGLFLDPFMNLATSWLKLDDLNRATELFDEAERRVKDNPVFAKRVSRTRMCIDYIWLLEYSDLHSLATATQSPFLGPVDVYDALEDFIDRAKVFDKSGLVDKWGKRFRKVVRDTTKALIPEIVKDLPREDWIDVQDNKMNLIDTLPGRDEWARTVEDDKASCGWAARMPGEHNGTVVQWSAGGIGFTPGRWQVYVVARYEADSDYSGVAFKIGFWHLRPVRTIVEKEVQVAPGGAEYQVYDLGVQELETRDTQFFAAPPGDGRVKYVYIDRLILVRAD